MKLIVGLGNPGSKYSRNRHNVGFMAVDEIANRHGFSPWRNRFSSHAAEGRLGTDKVLLIKPETFMNESGNAVRKALDFYKLDLADVIVIYDEIDLAPGKLKVKRGGGNAGHNGLRSLTTHLGNDYVRVRIGVGRPAQKSQVSGYVLRDFCKSDLQWLAPLLEAIANKAPLLASGDNARFMSEIALELRGEDDGTPKNQSGPKNGTKPVKSAPAPAAATKNPSASRSSLSHALGKWLGTTGDGDKKE